MEFVLGVNDNARERVVHSAIGERETFSQTVAKIRPQVPMDELMG